MTVPSNISTVAAALSYINANANISSVDLIQLARQMGAEVAGAKSILLYSGTLDLSPGSIVQSWEVAEAIATQSPANNKVATIGQTEFGKLLNANDSNGVNIVADKLKSAIAAEKGWAPTDLRLPGEVDKVLKGESLPDGTRITPGLWDEGSVKFIETNAQPGIPINTLTPTAQNHGTFSQAEIQAALASGAKVDGVDNATLQAVYNKHKADALAAGKPLAEANASALSEVQKSVKAASFDKSLDIEYVRDPVSGQVTSVSDSGGKFLSGVEDAMPHGHIPDSTPGKSTVSNALGNLPQSDWDDLIKGAKNLAVASDIDMSPPPVPVVGEVTKYGAKALVKLGIIGEIVGIGLMVSEAQAAVDNGDTNTAARIIADYAVGTLGGVVVGALTAGVVAALIPTAGVIGAAALLLAAVVGAAGGDAAAKAALDIALDKAGELGLLPPGGVDGILDDYGWAFDNPQDLIGGLLPEGIKGLLPSWLGPLAGAFGLSGDAIQAVIGSGSISPLVLDLDGDGIEVTKIGFGESAATVYFDLDNDGFAERTAWTTGGDGFLVWDRNSNGTIDNQTELFGNTSTYANGFANLASLDSNASGTITSADTNWANLKVWVDANGDGVSQSSELQTLASLGITSINVNAATQANVFNNENRVSHISTFTMNGQTKAIHDIWFRVDQVDSKYIGDVTLDVRTLFLPTLKGFGNLPDLHVAMSQNSALLTLVENFVANWTPARFATYQTLNADIQAILYKWAGVDGYATGATLYGVDAKIYGLMKALTGQDHIDTAGLLTTQSLSAANINSINAAARIAFEGMKAALILQAGGSELFTTAPTYNIATGMIEGDFILDSSAITAAMASYTPNPNGNDAWWGLTAFLVGLKPAENYSSADVAMLTAAGANFSNYGGNWYSWGVHTQALLRNPFTISGTQQSDMLVSSDQGDTLSGLDGDDYLYGNGDNDTMYGGNGNDTYVGGDGNDTLDDNGTSGNDIFNGGRGNEIITDSSGNDTYIYNLGDGADTITDSTGADIIKMGPGITASDLTFERVFETSSSNDHLRILINGQLALTLKNFFNDSVPGRYVIETIQFSDNSTLNLTVLQNVNGTSANETLNGLDLTLLKDDAIYGKDGNDAINGNLGNDLLSGGNGNDILNGGAGNDYLTGGVGDDEYIYSAIGMGNDRIYEAGGGSDKITFGAGLTAANVSLVRIGQYDLALQYAGQNILYIEKQFQNGNGLETIQWGDGSSLNLSTYNHTINGTSGNDSIYGVSEGAGGDILNGLGGVDVIFGGAGDDVINGGSENDSLYGEDGNDTISGGAGDDIVQGDAGNDILNYESGLDVFSGGSGVDIVNITNSAITAANMTLVRSGVNRNDLQIHLNGVHAFTISGQFSQNNGIETIKFYNGSTFDLSSVQYTTNGTSGADTLYGIGFGGNPNDIINGLDGNDTIYGYEGNDTITGGNGLDNLTGGAGNDTYIIALNSGLDTITDDGGVDKVLFGAGYSSSNMLLSWVSSDLNIVMSGVTVATVTSHFNYNNDRMLEMIEFSNGTIIDVRTVGFTQNGTAAANTLTGHNGKDILYGLDGNDGLTGYGGNDELYGGNGTDSLVGGDGDDLLDGGADADTLSGGNGNDTLTGGLATDNIYGNEGNDNFIWNIGDGSDNLYDTSGSTDILRFGAGITSSSLRFVLNSLDLQVWVGAEMITLKNQYSATSYNVVGLEKIIFADNSEINLLGTVTFTGTSSVDSMSGTANSDIMYGLDGNDTITAAAGDDILYGGNGVDALYGGDGADTFVWFTGNGNDTINESGTTTTDILKFGAGITAANVRFVLNSLDIQVWIGSEMLTIKDQYVAGTYAVKAIEKIIFNDNSELLLTGVVTFTGTSSADSMSGTSNNDIMYGLDGNDTITAGNGADIIYGGNGVDTLYGGDGADTFVWNIGNGNDSINESGTTTTDILQFGAGITANDLRFVRSSLDMQVWVGSEMITVKDQYASGTYTLKAIEKIVFSDNSELLLTSGMTYKGTATADFVYGAGGNDNLYGLDGNDSLYGNDGNDTLYGGNGTDTLYGDNGLDTLLADVGIDTMYGGAGADTFKFSTSSLDGTIDVIKDYNATQLDAINIKDLLIGYDPLTSAITNFVEMTTSGSNTILKIDRDGAGGTYTWTQIATIEGVTGMTDEATLLSQGRLVAT